MSNQISATSVVSYKGVFDPSIYDQTEYLQNRKNENITENGLKEHLHKKKMERLQKVILNKAQGRIEDYNQIVNQHAGFWDTILKPLAQMLPFLPVNTFDEEMRVISKAEAKKRLFELTFEIKMLMDGLDKEQICDLERQYILKKREISLEICDQVEKILLLAREDGIPLEFFRQFIDNALKLPNSIKLLYDFSLHKIISTNEFKNFDPNLQHKIKCITKKLIIDSQQTKEDSCLRSIYYFYGKPSTGKSTTARLIPESLNLPYKICSIKQAEDLSRGNLEGDTRTFNSQNPGLLGEALMSQNEEGKSYHNAVLIIEEFDRLLFPEGGGSSVSGSLAFLLDYLDPDKKSFFSPYFLAKIKVSSLSIILTANHKIPEKPEDPKGKDPYAALRSRVEEIHFPEFPPETIKSICIPYAEKIGQKYNLSESVINAKKTQWIDEAINRQRVKTFEVELRDLKRQIELIVIEESFQKF